MALRLNRRVLSVTINEDGSGSTEVAPPNYRRTAAAARRAQREDLMIVLAANLVEQAREPVSGWWRL